MQVGLFEKAHFRTAGDRGLLVEYGDIIDPDVNNKVRSMAMVMEQDSPEGVTEVIPTYRSLLIVYDPARTNPVKLQKTLKALESRLGEIKIPPPVTVEIPVCYGGEFGPDIEVVAGRPQYLIYMVGFTPGFPFLGGLSEKLQTPRLETPRTFVHEGSVGIANNQTGIYPVASPGGWRILGRTPVKLFAPGRRNPFLYQAGDRIKFSPISAEEYARIFKQEQE
jgi:KipI family sensor histidine kinase inhibitor